MTSRLAEVEPERLAGWVERFRASHGSDGGGDDGGAAGERLVLRSADGAVAELEVPWPPLPPGGGVAALAAHAAMPRTALLVLVRRGGWAVGVARDGAVLDSSGGTRYVQARTAAGGWSQQRYARRRANQADGLVVAASAGLAALLGRAGATGAVADVVVPGGDRQLVDDVLAEAPPVVRALPRGPLLDVVDPRRRVLDDVARRARCVRIRVDQPD